MKLGPLILVLAGTVFAQSPVRVEFAEATAHQLSDPAILRTPNHGFFGSVRFEIRVDTSGQVVDAKAISGKPDLLEQATRLVRSQKYAPFVRDGQPVEASLEAWVQLLPPEILPTVHRAFPEVKDGSTVRISLTRTGCYGPCPSYELEILGDGTVTYTGHRYVAVSGEHKSAISREAVQRLLAQFREADYFSFDPKYALIATDGATFTTSISIDGQTHSVVDYMGAQVGMPLVIERLEKAVDDVSGSEKWIRAQPTAK